MPDKSCEELILKIRAVWDELMILNIKPQKIRLEDLSQENLEMEFEAFSDQLKARKRFLGVDSYGKSNGTKS